MFHGWSFIEKSHFAGALWGRGNCWITVGLPDYIDIMEGYLEESVKEHLVSALNMQIAALEKYQDENGAWHTLINDKSSYCEISATSGFCYGIFKSVRKGYADKKYLTCAEKALAAVIDNVAEDGTVENVSYGPGLYSDLNEYKNIEITPMTYGQALAALCISESMKGEEK